MRHVSDDERRARLATRHAIAPGSRVASVEAAARAMVVLHATEPATVPLSCWARVDGLERADVDRALYADRAVVKQLAMRRTLFAAPRDLLPALWVGPSARVAGFERGRLAKDVVLAGIAEDGEAWLDRARADVLAFLAEAPEGRTALEVREGVPSVDVRLDVTGGSTWAAPRVLTHLGATADVVRGDNTGHWRTSRPRWTLTGRWLPDGPVPWGTAIGGIASDSTAGPPPTASDPPPPAGPPSVAAAYRELVRRWLGAFGPGTEDDLVWWLGATKSAVRVALAELDAVEVTLDRDGRGWLLPDDLAEPPDPGPWVALLPVLDPTTMGWKGRDFHLGPYRDQLFDRNNNAGTTAWVDGRIVGCWTQDAAGAVELHLLRRVRAGARRELQAEARRLTAWLGGERVGTVYRSPAMGTGRPDVTSG
jgi:hypothetical protein